MELFLRHKGPDALLADHHVLLQEDTVTDQNGEILHYTKLVINSDRYRLTVIT